MKKNIIAINWKLPDTAAATKTMGIKDFGHHVIIHHIIPIPMFARAIKKGFTQCSLTELRSENAGSWIPSY